MATTKLLCSTAMLKTIENVLVKIYNHDALRESTLLYLALLLLAFHVLLQWQKSLFAPSIFTVPGGPKKEGYLCSIRAWVNAKSFCHTRGAKNSRSRVMTSWNWQNANEASQKSVLLCSTYLDLPNTVTILRCARCSSARFFLVSVLCTTQAKKNHNFVDCCWVHYES